MRIRMGGRVPSSGDLQDFTTALGDLKHAGCMVLVTGTVDETVRAATSRQLFGMPKLPRKRVLVPIEDSPLPLTTYLPNGITLDSTSVRLCEWDQPLCDRRSESESERLTSDGGPLELAACFQRLTSVLAEDEATSDESVPGELRVGILTLAHIIEQYGQTATAAFLARLGQRIRSHHGMGHCHLPSPSNSTQVTSLVGTVDIHIHLRDRNGYPPEQRWFLCETDHNSAWMPLSG